MAAPTAGPSPTTSPSPDAGPPGGLAPKGMIPAEWPAQAADTIVDTIAKVRERTTRPALVAARALVYGLLAVIVGSIALVLGFIALVRLWSNYVPGDVWILYLLLFAILSPTGIVLLKRANQPVEPVS